jgi:hypothetical protein
MAAPPARCYSPRAMARKERRAPGPARLQALLDAGDHRTARAEATARLRDASAPDAEKAQAAAVLASLAPERGAVVAGALGVAAAVAIAAWTILAG